MVNFTDLKGYKSAFGPGLGGSIDTGLQVMPATPNNILTNQGRPALQTGSVTYGCMFFKNTSSEPMDNFKIWLSSGTPLDYTSIEFGFDELASPYRGALKLDGDNDYVQCGNHSNLWSKSLSKFSFSFWIYPLEAGSGSQRTVINHGNVANNSFDVYIDDGTSPTRIKFRIVDSGGTHHIVGSNNLTLDTWQHIICSYDNTLGSDNLKIYLNGILDVDVSFNDDFTGSINISSDLLIGGTTDDFSGYFRNFKFWDSQSINSTEALQLYTDETTHSDTFTSEPAYHLLCNERTGNPGDKVSGTKSGVLTNGATWQLSAVTISTRTEPPVGVTTWYNSGDRPGGLGRISAGESFPIWLKLTVDPDSPTDPVMNDSGIFTIQFETTDTDSTGTPGTGGGTGGSTGGTSTSNFSVCFAGDWGCESETDDVIDLIKDRDYDLVVGVGDNAYESASCWTSRFRPFQNKMISAYGNHEYEESGGTSPYKSFFGDSSSSSRGGIVYTHRFQNMLFLIMDTNDDKSGVDLDAQRTFFRNELEKYKNDSRVVWRIAVCHHPWFGDGGKHSENEFNQVQKFHKMFTDYNVNFVYTGHNHNWHRSHQVAFDSGTPKTPNIVDSSSPYTRTSGGLMQINTGMGGHDDPGGSYSLPDDASFWAYRNKSNNGVHELVATNNGKTLTGKFRNTNGSTFDTFTITA